MRCTRPVLNFIVNVASRTSGSRPPSPGGHRPVLGRKHSFSCAIREPRTRSWRAAGYEGRQCSSSAEHGEFWRESYNHSHSRRGHQCGYHLLVLLRCATRFFDFDLETEAVVQANANGGGTSISIDDDANDQAMRLAAGAAPRTPRYSTVWLAHVHCVFVMAVVWLLLRKRSRS
jgi:hypothetical protein